MTIGIVQRFLHETVNGDLDRQRNLIWKYRLVQVHFGMGALFVNIYRAEMVSGRVISLSCGTPNPAERKRISSIARCNDEWITPMSSPTVTLSDLVLRGFQNKPRHDPT